MVDSDDRLPTANGAVTGEQPSPPVGYKRPPKSSQFGKVRSAVLAGRRKGQKNIATLLKAILDDTILVSVGGQAKRMTKMEALVKFNMQRAREGHDASLTFVLFVAEKTGRVDDLQACGDGTGIAIVPERSETHEQWEADHGAAARGDNIAKRHHDAAHRPRTSTIEAGDELLAEGDLLEAFNTYRRALSLRKRPLDACTTDDERQRLYDVVDKIVNVAFSLLLNRQYQEAMDVSIHAEAAMLQEPWVYACRLCALICLDRREEAMCIFEQFRGQRWSEYQAEGIQQVSWESGLADILFELETHGLSHPAMKELLNELTSATGKPAPPQ